MKTVILDNIYRNGNLVTTMFRNGSLIYQRATKAPVVDYSSMYLTIEALESGTFYVRNSNVGYSINEGTWETTEGATSLQLSQGDKVRFKGTNGGSYLFSGNTIDFDVYGNIESLEYGDNFTGQTQIKRTYAFQLCFTFCSGLNSAENLILPVLSLTDWCYYAMFRYCENMVKAPELPATTLGAGCYNSMFSNCFALTETPVLPAPVLVSSCYQTMFYECTNLNKVTCLATNISASASTDMWLQSVSSTGTFYGKQEANWGSGVSGIPNGWTSILEAQL